MAETFGTTHWERWHEAYADESSPLTQRLRAVQARVAEAVVAAAPGDVRLVSLCAGQAHDVAGALAHHPRAADVVGRLVEWDAANARAARERLADAGLSRLRVVVGDASLTDAWFGAVPADVVLLCGIFGNVPDTDVERTVRAASRLCASRATVVWTRHRRSPDLTPLIRTWFAESGFAEVGFDSPGPQAWAVGTARLTGEPLPLLGGLRLFAFDDSPSKSAHPGDEPSGSVGSGNELHPPVA